MNKIIANELADCSYLAQYKVATEFDSFQSFAEWGESEMQAIVDAIESLPNLEEIDSTGKRQHYLEPITKCISSINEILDVIYEFVSEPTTLRDAIVGLQKTTEVVLQRAEAEEKRIRAKEISNEL